MPSVCRMASCDHVGEQARRPTGSAPRLLAGAGPQGARCGRGSRTPAPGCRWCRSARGMAELDDAVVEQRGGGDERGGPRFRCCGQEPAPTEATWRTPVRWRAAPRRSRCRCGRRPGARSGGRWPQVRPSRRALPAGDDLAGAVGLHRRLAAPQVDGLARLRSRCRSGRCRHPGQGHGAGGLHHGGHGLVQGCRTRRRGRR